MSDYGRRSRAPRSRRGSSLLDELTWRGLLYQRTAQAEFDKHLATPGRVGYCGFDPTADSLTIGNLIALKLLAHWQRSGHKPVVVVGGGTGLIGDPSGKDAERPLLSRDQVEANVAGQRRVFERLLDFDSARPNAAVVRNNAEWLGKLGYIEMLRDVGKHFSVNAMLQKESVRERLRARGRGISYTEFSYVLLQATDFLHLHREMNCTVQMAGSDQYGNIVAGIELIRRMRGGAEAFGVTAPLVTHAAGRKVGKSEKGSIWLTADRTSPYAFYQYWINVPDTDAGGFLRRFTFLPRDEIEELTRRHGRAPHERVAQRVLAREVTDLIHGKAERKRVEAASEALFGAGELRSLDARSLDEILADVPHSVHDKALLGGNGASLVEVLPGTGLASSRREAREFLGSRAVWVNGRRVSGSYHLTEADLLHGRAIFLRRGRRQWHVTTWA